MEGRCCRLLHTRGTEPPHTSHCDGRAPVNFPIYADQMCILFRFLQRHTNCGKRMNKIYMTWSSTGIIRKKKTQQRYGTLGFFSAIFCFLEDTDWAVLLVLLHSTEGQSPTPPWCVVWWSQPSVQCMLTAVRALNAIPMRHHNGRHVGYEATEVLDPDSMVRTKPLPRRHLVDAKPWWGCHGPHNSGARSSTINILSGVGSKLPSSCCLC